LRRWRWRITGIEEQGEVVKTWSSRAAVLNVEWTWRFPQNFQILISVCISNNVATAPES